MVEFYTMMYKYNAGYNCGMLLKELEHVDSRKQDVCLPEVSLGRQQQMSLGMFSFLIQSKVLPDELDVQGICTTFGLTGDEFTLLYILRENQWCQN